MGQVPTLRVSFRLIATLLTVAFFFIILAWLIGPILKWAPIDFCRFYTASKMILDGQIPYGELPFFAPPWLAFVLSPLLIFPCSSAALAWILTNIALTITSTGVLGMLASVPRRYRLLVGTASALLPYAVFTYITGQLSIITLASCTLCAWGLSRRHREATVIGLLLATLKPHIVALPMLLVLLELLRRRRWSSLFAASVGLLALCIVGLAFVPTWPQALLTSWTSGSFYEPRKNLLGLAAFGVPVWLTYPFIGYALLLWWQRRLDLHTLALGVTVNLLAIPYSRSYDYILLLIPVAAIWRTPSSLQKGIALGLALTAQLLPLIRATIPRAGLPEALAPAFCTAALLLVSRLRWKDLSLSQQAEH
jgi:hypothetical protein